MTVSRGIYVTLTDKCKEPIPKTLCTLLFMRWSGDLYLLLELSQLSWQVGHQPHGRLQLFLQVPYFILFPLAVTAHQGHGTHPREPVQVVLLIDHQANQWLTFFIIQKVWCTHVSGAEVTSEIGTLNRKLFLVGEHDLNFKPGIPDGMFSKPLDLSIW